MFSNNIWYFWTSSNFENRVFFRTTQCMKKKKKKWQGIHLGVRQLLLYNISFFGYFKGWITPS